MPWRPLLKNGIVIFRELQVYKNIVEEWVLFYKRAMIVDWHERAGKVGQSNLL